MSKSLLEYIDYLKERPELIWPKPPKPAPLKATPFLKPIPGIRLVTWEIYGTLLTIDGGRLMQHHPQQLRMQIAIEKTIEEFHMWYSMTRKPGHPWEYMLRQYEDVLQELQMVGTKRKGDYPEVNSVKIWHKLLDRLQRNEYEWDVDFFGDLDGLASKVAYFFHACLQGTAAAEKACDTLKLLTSIGIRQGLLADAQPFSVAQLIDAMRAQSPIIGINEVLSGSFQTLSADIGFRKPSPSLFDHAVEQIREAGLEPSQVLHVSHRLKEDLGPAKKAGFHTALLAADANCTSISNTELRNPEYKPDRLVTSIQQVVDIVGG